MLETSLPVTVKMSKEKRKKLSLEDFEERYSSKETFISTLRSKIDGLDAIPIEELLQLNRPNVSENDVLIILSKQLTLHVLETLRTAMRHVPESLNLKRRNSVADLRIIIISNILTKFDIEIPIGRLGVIVAILEKFCPTFLEHSSKVNERHLLDTTFSDGYAINFLCPPKTYCSNCGGDLCMHNLPARAKLFDLDGVHPASKISLECKNCQIRYGVTKWSDSTGSYYYPEQVNLIEVSNTTFMDATLYNWIPSLR